MEPVKQAKITKRLAKKFEFLKDETVESWTRITYAKFAPHSKLLHYPWWNGIFSLHDLISHSLQWSTLQISSDQYAYARES